MTFLVQFNTFTLDSMEDAYVVLECGVCTLFIIMCSLHITK